MDALTNNVLSQGCSHTGGHKSKYDLSRVHTNPIFIYRRICGAHLHFIIFVLLLNVQIILCKWMRHILGSN